MSEIDGKKSAYSLLESRIIHAVLEENITTLYLAHFLKFDFDKIYDKKGRSLLHLAIKHNKVTSFDALIYYGASVDNPSPKDGTTPLNAATIANKPYFVSALIAHGANVNLPGKDGLTPLINAADSEHWEVAKLILQAPQLDVNVPDANNILPLFHALVKKNPPLAELILEHNSFDPTFSHAILHKLLLNPVYGQLKTYLSSFLEAADINLVHLNEFIKLYGIKHDIPGCFHLTQLKYHGQACTKFLGYYNWQSVPAFKKSYQDFYERVVTQVDLPNWAAQSFVQINQSLQYMAKDLWDPKEVYQRYANQKLVIIPSGWPGHSITFVLHHDRLYRCNRGSKSDHIHGIEEFKIHNLQNLTVELIAKMLKSDQPSSFSLETLVEILDLEKVGAIENPMQLVGNCTWTSLEAALEAAFVSTFLDQGLKNKAAHSYGKQSFQVWKDFDSRQSVLELLEHKEALLDNDIFDKLLLGTLLMHHEPKNPTDVFNGIVILDQLKEPVLATKFNDLIGRDLSQLIPKATHEISYLESFHTPMIDKVFGGISSKDANIPAEREAIVRDFYPFLKVCDYWKNTLDKKLSMEDILVHSSQDRLEALFDPSPKGTHKMTVSLPELVPSWDHGKHTPEIQFSEQIFVLV